MEPNRERAFSQRGFIEYAAIARQLLASANVAYIHGWQKQVRIRSGVFAPRSPHSFDKFGPVWLHHDLKVTLSQVDDKIATAARLNPQHRTGDVFLTGTAFLRR
jgi:hypothetical protein